jgi:hypothetical protein
MSTQQDLDEWQHQRVALEAELKSLLTKLTLEVDRIAHEMSV